MNELRASYEKKGLRIVAISSEDAGKVGEFVIANAITYPVGIAKKTQDYGSGGIPHAYLISPAGKVVWDGHPAALQNGQIEKLLRKTKDF
ncbi:MAG: peroxiredoxin family protein, partial [Planctomycetota bacterium]